MAGKHDGDGFAPMRIHANAIVMVIRREYSTGGEAAALKAGRQCFVEGVTDEQIIKVAKGEATFTGCTPGPITYEAVTP
jgi:hypothetical protein